LDAIIDSISEHCVEYGRVRAHATKTIYPITAQDSVHMKLFRDFIVHTLSRKSFARTRGYGLPSAFIEDLLVDIGSQLEEGVPEADSANFFEQRDVCQYYEHVRFNKPC
jgi:hypothetical protein